MRRTFIRIGIALLALLVSAPIALAQESTSFQMNDDVGNFGSNDPASGTTFDQSQGGQTWHEGELTGASFQITDSTFIDTGTSGGTTGGTATGGGGEADGGNRRPRVDFGSSSSSSAAGETQSSARSRPPRKPAAPTTSASSTPAFEQHLEDIDTLLTSEALRRAAERRAARGEAQLQFFDAVDPLCPPTPVHTAAPDEPFKWLWLLLISVLLGGHISFVQRKRVRKFLRKKKNRAYVACLILALTSFVIGMVLLGVPTNAYAANDTVPALRIYKGNLFNSAGTPVTSSVTIRFSYWNSADHVTTDTTSTGAINTGAATYLGWYEVHTITPTSKGSFTAALGSITPLANLKNLALASITSLHLQVEVKNTGSPDTAYELLDVNAANTAVDRSKIVAVPLARNADLLDQHDTGTGSFDIPVLNNFGKLPFSTIPGGTEAELFKIDNDASGTGIIALQFGTGLSKQLNYDNVNSRFNFLDSVMIQGDLTVTGLINGIDFNALQSSTGALKASSGAGLTINVAGGSYRMNGTVTNYLGSSGVAVPPSTSSNVFFGSGGLTVRTIGFPTDESYIPVAVVTTSANGVLTVADRRVLNSDDRENTVQAVYNAEFQNATYQGDGADNIGQLVVSHDNTDKRNFYQWSSTRPTLQDYDILLKVHLSPDFVRWKTGGGNHALAVTYRTTSASSAANKLDISVFDTNGVPVTLSGSVSNLANTSWTTTVADFSGGTWTSGQDFLVRLRSSAKDNFQVHIANMKFEFVDLQRE